MHFTQEDYRKIEDWLYQRTVKDTQFPYADPVDGTERVPILQGNKNKTIGLNDFVKQVADMKLPDFYNVTVNSKKPYLTLKEAVSLVPVKQRKLGLTITYHNEYGNWLIYQFKGDSLNQWDSLNYWNNIIQQAIEEFVLYPDEEDITGVRDGNRTFLKFKNREYNPEEFSGMGMIILRKNLVGTAACSIDDEDHLNNVLTQDMINQENTVYIVQYDFDLDGKVISIPKGCTLWFQGGSINNGTMYLQETAILGAFEFADMGTAKLFGKFNTGQIMTFSNDSYKAKEGGYFVPSTKPSSATPEEDAKQDRETFYDKNPNAYVTKKRQELRWWNGEEWILILDITDYNEIKSIINDLIEKHNAEMSACYKYFKARCYALELRMDEAEKRIENHEERITIVEGDIVNIKNDIIKIKQDISDIESNITVILNKITEFGDVINNIEKIITEQIENYIKNNIIGVASVTVNGTKYDPDENGNITLPDYPESGGGTADRVAGTLTFTGASTATYDGSSDVTVNIPEGGSGGGGPADSVKGTLTVKSSGGTTLVTYNGSSDETLTLPASGGGSASANELLTIKQGDTTLGTYDGTEPKTINIPTSGVADKVAKKLKFTGASTAEYDGSEEVTVNIPAAGGGNTIITAKEPLVVKQGETTLLTYTGEEPKTLVLPESSSTDNLGTLTLKENESFITSGSGVKKQYIPNQGDAEITLGSLKFTGGKQDYYYNPLKGNQEISISDYERGSSSHPIVLLSGQLSRNSTSSTAWSFNGIKHKDISSVSITAKNNVRLEMSINSASGVTAYPVTVIANAENTGGSKILGVFNARYEYLPLMIQSAVTGGNRINLVAFYKDDHSNWTLASDGINTNNANKLLSANIIVTGYITKY